jgi:hypothetical protein
MTTLDNVDLAHAKEQGQAQFNSIVELVETLNAARERDETAQTGGSIVEIEEIERAIHEDALSVEVRVGWHIPGVADFETNKKPAEYRILLCTGGPAVQIVGELNAHCEPETARIEIQDWFQPWTQYCPRYKNSHNFEAPDWHEDAEAAKEILLTYVSCFYYGE